MNRKSPPVVLLSEGIRCERLWLSCRAAVESFPEVLGLLVCPSLQASSQGFVCFSIRHHIHTLQINIALMLLKSPGCLGQPSPSGADPRGPWVHFSLTIEEGTSPKT